MSDEHVSNDATLGDGVPPVLPLKWWSQSPVSCLLSRPITGVCLRCFLSATGRAVSKLRRPTHLLPEHVECPELIACNCNYRVHLSLTRIHITHVAAR